MLRPLITGIPHARYHRAEEGENRSFARDFALAARVWPRLLCQHLSELQTRRESRNKPGEEGACWRRAANNSIEAVTNGWAQNGDG